MKKLLFLIPNLKHGGAEKVLVNLVNNLDPEKYDITVQTLFNVGVHRDTLKPHIHYRSVMQREFRGNTTFFKLFSPRFLWKCMVKDRYDVAISYLEGPTNRILGGCADSHTKKVAWIHTVLNTSKMASIGFRTPGEAERIYNSFDHIIAVSQKAKTCFVGKLKITAPTSVLYNTNETEQIIQGAKEMPQNTAFHSNAGVMVCSVGKLTKIKGFDRLLNVHKRLLDEGLAHHIFILGIGEDRRILEQQIRRLGVGDTFTLLGFDQNPYQYVSRCDLYVCSSYREGFSTAVTEALILGVPVVSTLCSGARELLGENNEYGIVVENSEEGIYAGMKKMLSDPLVLAHYKKKAKERGPFFSKEASVRAVENMLDNL